MKRIDGLPGPGPVSNRDKAGDPVLGGAYYEIPSGHFSMTASGSKRSRQVVVNDGCVFGNDSGLVPSLISGPFIGWHLSGICEHLVHGLLIFIHGILFFNL